MPSVDSQSKPELQRQSSQNKDFEMLFRQLLEKETIMRLKDDHNRFKKQSEQLKQQKENKNKKDQFDIINKLIAEESKRDS